MDKIFMLNPKIFVGAAVTAIVIILAIVATSGSSIINDISAGPGFMSSPQTNQEVLPLEIELEDLSVLSISDKDATLEIKFKVSNPNYKSIILQMIRYDLYESDLRVAIKTIGDRDAGMLASSNYYTILNDRPTILSDKIIIENSGNIPEFWDALNNNSPQWRITGEAFYNLSSMTAGGENEIKFEFTK